METLGELIIKRHVPSNVPLKLSVVIDSIKDESKIWSFLKDSRSNWSNASNDALKTYLENELDSQDAQVYHMTYISDKDSVHANTPVIFVKDAIIYLGVEGKWFSSNVPTWKIICCCDITKYTITKTELNLFSRKKFTFMSNATDKEGITMANIAQFIEYTSSIPKNTESVTDPDLKRIYSLSQQIKPKPVQRIKVLGGRRRKTKRAKKNKRRTRRS